MDVHGLSKGINSQDPGTDYCIFPTHKLAETFTQTIIMKLVPFIIPLMAVFTQAMQSEVTCDPFYDNFKGQTKDVTCGFKLAKNFPQFGNFSNFPKLGGSSRITNTGDTAECGSCWRLSTSGGYIFVIALDAATPGGSVTRFNIAEEACYSLTGPDQPLPGGNILVEAEIADEKLCGLSQVS